MASRSLSSHRRQQKGATTTSSSKDKDNNNSSSSKVQKHFDQLRRLILGRNPSLDEIQALVELDPLCVQERDPHHALLPLHWAIVFQNPLDIVQYLTEQYPAAITETDHDGRLPLHHSCRPEGSVELTAYLLEQNSRVATQRDHRGKTPLHCACMEGVPSDIPRLLLESNPACAKIRTREGQTALFVACDSNAPSTTVQLLVDAYPEAVKYLTTNSTNNNTNDTNSTGGGGGKFAQAKEYLAWKVQQTEEQARTAAKQKTRYDPVDTTTDDIDNDANNVTSESDQVRRRLEEEERQIELEQKQLSKMAKEAALKTLQKQEQSVEQQKAELDRLIQQKEAQLDTGRFHQQAERIYGDTTNTNARNPLNDSGIVRNRSFNANANNLPPSIQIGGGAKAATTTPHQAPRPESQHYGATTNIHAAATPSVLSSRGVSVEFDTYRDHTDGKALLGLDDQDIGDIDDDEDDAYFNTLRQNNTQQQHPNTTQPLYQESKVHSGEDTAWMDPLHNNNNNTTTPRGSKPRGRDPSPADIHYAELGEEPPSNPLLDQSHMRYEEIRNPSPPTPRQPQQQQEQQPVQAQLQQALQALDYAEEQRKSGIKGAQEQQIKLQEEIVKLMEKLQVREQQLAAAEQERLQQEQLEDEEKARVEQEQAMQQQQRNRKQPPGEGKKSEINPQHASDTAMMVRGYFGGSGTGSTLLDQAPTRAGIATTANSTHVSTAMGQQQQQAQPQQQPTPRENANAMPKDFWKDGQGQTPLHIALAHGASYTSVQFLLQQFPLAIYQTDSADMTPLHCACSCTNTPLEVLQLLLDIFPGATLMTNSQQQLPLHLACQYHGHRVEVLQLLFDMARTVEQDLAAAEASQGEG